MTEKVDIVRSQISDITEHSKVSLTTFSLNHKNTACSNNASTQLLDSLKDKVKHLVNFYLVTNKIKVV